MRNNSTAGMKHLLEFVINADHSSIILVSAPHQYDLMSNSCVNVEVEKFNRNLHKSLERFRKVEMVEVVSERNLYTKHGQHLNSESKESMAKKIASTIECWFNKKVEPIREKWYTEEETGILDHQPMQGKIDNNPEEGNKEYSSTSGVVDTLYMKTRFCQKLKMVIGRANLLIQQFSHLLVGFKSPLINEFTPLEYLLI